MPDNHTKPITPQGGRWWPIDTDPRVVRAYATLEATRRMLAEPPLSPGSADSPDILGAWLFKLLATARQLHQLVDITRQVTPYMAGDDLVNARGWLENTIEALERAHGHYQTTLEAQRELDA